MASAHKTPPPDPLDAANGTLDLVRRAARDGAADASEAAARTLSAAGRMVQRIVYRTCYTISFGVVFPSVLVARMVPRDNAAVRGLIDGAQAACERVRALPSPASVTRGASPAAGLVPT
jgi:hypothetical protein